MTPSDKTTSSTLDLASINFEEIAKKPELHVQITRSLVSHLEQFQNIIERFESRLQEQTQEITHLQTENKNLKTINTCYEARVSSVEEKNQQLQTENRALKSQLNAQKARAPVNLEPNIEVYNTPCEAFQKEGTLGYVLWVLGIRREPVRN